MCGIAGVFGLANFGPSELAAIVRRLADTQLHRGPDAGGEWADERGRCAFSHRRLSIIDTSDAGRQPMESADGRWVITFNGEIYNFQDVRRELEAEGVGFRGRTDTEVLLAALQVWGLEALAKLDGMFAFAAFDRVSGELTLARDPFGEKPLYYLETKEGGVAFASELQALEMLPGFDPEVSVDAMAEVLMFQYIGAPRTIYRSVKKLPPGHWMVARAGQPLRIGRYYEFQPGTGGFDARPISDLADELEDILVRSIRRRLIADVPLGAFLSGGVDSSTVCALARRRLDVPLKTFSIGFEGAPESEHEVARQFAAHLGTEHYDRVLTPDASAFLLGIGGILDEPNADSSCMPTFLLSAFAREQVTVAVSGDGGDEMFAGYGRYFATIQADEEHMRGGRSGWRPGRGYYSESILVTTEPHIRELFGEIPSGLAEHLQRLRDEVDQPRPPLHCRLRRSDVENYMPGAVLPKVDRMSMRHSLEVRTPFLNVELARFAERLPDSVLYRKGAGKLVLREIAYRYLPRRLIDAPKKGFGIPMASWGREPLLRVAAELLESPDSRLRECLGPGALDAFLSRQRSRGGFSTYQVWSLAMLESWLRHHPAKLPRLDAGRAAGRKTGPTRAPDLHALFFGSSRALILENRPVEGDDAATRAASDHQLVRTLDLLEADPWTRREEGAASAVPKGLVAIPGWSQPLEKAGRAFLRALRGRTLLFPETDPAERFDGRELEKWARSGISGALFFHPHRFDGAVLSLALRRPIKPVHLRRRAALWRRRIATWKLADCGRRDGQGFEIGLQCVPMQTGVDLSGRYLVFQGLRQLPPIPAGHDDVNTRGGGRYSVWEQRCIFSLADDERTSTFWMVENTAVTRELLPAVPAVIERPASTHADYFANLSRWLHARQAPAFAALKPGDSVVVMTHALPPGGAERQWCYLARGLKERGFKVTFLVTEHLEGTNAHYQPLLASDGIEVLNAGGLSLQGVLDLVPGDRELLQLLSPSRSPFGARLPQVYAMLRRLAPKAVFAQLDTPNTLGAVAALLADIPRAVLSFRNFSPRHFSYLANDWYLPAYRAAVVSPRVVLSGNSHVANDDYAQWIGLPAAAIACIPNAIDVDSLSRPAEDALQRLREEIGLPEAAPLIVGVFRLSEEKQPHVFLEVCKRLHREFPALRVAIAGIGPLLAEVERTRDVMGLTDVVKLLGRRDDVPAIMSIASLVLLTSTLEGMPNVLLEAQALGVPVVATRVGGVPDCVEHGRTGFVVASKDADGLVGACRRLLLDPALARSMGHSGAKLMRESYSIAALAERHLALAGAKQVAPSDAVSDGETHEAL